MSSEGIERFDLVYDRAFDGTIENPHIGPWVTGSFIRLSDHERIVKELEARLSSTPDIVETMRILDDAGYGKEPPNSLPEMVKKVLVELERFRQERNGN